MKSDKKKKPKTIDKKKKVVKKKKKESEILLTDVDTPTEGILYFIEFILVKHFVKIVAFFLLIAFTFIGFECKTKWGNFEKEKLEKPFSDHE